MFSERVNICKGSWENRFKYLEKITDGLGCLSMQEWYCDIVDLIGESYFASTLIAEEHTG